MSDANCTDEGLSTVDSVGESLCSIIFCSNFEGYYF